MFAGEDDCGKAGEAGGRGVAKEGFARLCVVAAGVELVEGGGGCDEKVEPLEERGHFVAEMFEALTEGVELNGRESGSPGEALGDYGLEMLEVAARDVRIEIICPAGVKPLGFIGREERFEMPRLETRRRVDA